MTDQELEREAEEYAEVRQYQGTKDRSLKCELKDAYLAGAKRLRWIPVSERLPEPGQDVLCALWDRLSKVQWLAYDYCVKGRARSTWSELWTNSDVTHWMPLPVLPAPEGEGK